MPKITIPPPVLSGSGSKGPRQSASQVNRPPPVTSALWNQAARKSNRVGRGAGIDRTALADIGFAAVASGSVRAINDIEEIWRRLAAMAAMQERHNRLVHPQWEQQGHAYYRAVWVECAELLDHFGWKWWKRQQADLDQVRLEVIDIWHFGLSEILRAGELNRDLARRFGQALGKPAGRDFRLAVEALALSSLTTRTFDLDAFAAVMRALPLDFDQLYRIYVGKNVLNAFRQTHGYKSGDYRKTWDGREDNEHLVELASALDARSDAFPEELAAALEKRYAESS